MRTRGLALAAIAIGFLMTLAGNATAGFGVLVLWAGFAFTLTGGAIKRWGGGLLVAFIAGLVGTAMGGNSSSSSSPSSATSPPSATRSTTAPPPPARATKDEPCRVEAPASARAAAQKWCEDGVFTLVHVNMDANNVIVLLTFSQKSATNFAAKKFAVLNQFRGLADEMAKASDMNVAFSFHDPDGQMVGGCARDRSASESICR